MALVNLAFPVLWELKILNFAWSWPVVLGTAGTVLLALVFSSLARRPVPRTA